MGKGDKKSKRGKIVRGSYGVRRPRKKTDSIVAAPVKEFVAKEVPSKTDVVAEKKAPAKKAAPKAVAKKKE